MELKKIFKKCKYNATDGHPDIFWSLIGWSCALIVFVLGLSHLGVSFLKYKGIL